MIEKKKITDYIETAKKKKRKKKRSFCSLKNQAFKFVEGSVLRLLKRPCPLAIENMSMIKYSRSLSAEATKEPWRVNNRKQVKSIKLKHTKKN